MTSEALITAFALPPAATVAQRVPKKLLLENGAPTAADKRLITEGIEELHWLAALKPAVIAVPEFRDSSREYLEIAVLQLIRRSPDKTDRLIELVHRAVPYPVLLLLGDDGLSMAHKRQAQNEAGKTVLDGAPVTVQLADATTAVQQALLQALPLAFQPRANLRALYQGWMDVLHAFRSAQHTGALRLLDSAEQIAARREALEAVSTLGARIATLHSAASKTTQLAEQARLNLEIQRLRGELRMAQSRL